MPVDSTSNVKNASHATRTGVKAHAPARGPETTQASSNARALPRGAESDAAAGRQPATNTRLAYAGDWKHFSAWCRRTGLASLPPAPTTIARYLEACAAGENGSRPLSPASIERRLCGLAWNTAQRGDVLDRSAPEIAGALAGIRSRAARPAHRREAIDATDILAMLGTLPHDLRGLRDRAILLLGFAAGLRRAQIVGLDIGSAVAADSLGVVTILPEGLVLVLRETDGWRQMTVGRGSGETSCPVAAVERWIRFARLTDGPLFRRIGRDGRTVGGARLADKHVARLVKQTALAAGLDAERSGDGRARAFGADALRAGRQSPSRAGRFRINLTRALGL